MALVEALTIEVGTSIAKSILKLWLKDADAAVDASSSILDVIKGQTSDRIAQKRAQRQFETIGEKVGESLMPLFKIEGAGLEEGTHEAVALAVAETINALTSTIAAQQNLEPSTLAKYLLHAHSAKSYHFSTTETTLYERIITESCTYIIDIASQLPAFTEHTLAEVLKRESKLIEITEKILVELLRLREQLDPRVEAKRFELEYRRTVVRHLDELQLFGADIDTASKRHRLSIAYITLSVEQTISPSPTQDNQSPQGKVDAKDVEQQNRVKRQIVTVNEALSNSRYLLIRGLAGSGKTTLLQWIAVNAASQTFPDSLKDWNGMLPFYIRLRQCIQTKLPQVEDFPSLIAPAIADMMPKDWARNALDEGHAIVLIDGLDEVPSAQRENVRIWLKDLIARYPNARFILTSRPHAVEEGWLDIDTFKDSLLQPLIPSKIAFSNQ